MADRNVDIKSDGSGGFVLHPSPVGGNSNPPVIFPGNTITWHNQSGQTCCVSNFDPAVMDPAALTIPDGDKGASKVKSLPSARQVKYSVTSGPCTAAALRVQVGPGTGGIIIVDPPPVDDDKDDDKPKGKSKSGGAKRKVKSKTRARSKPKSKSSGKARPKAKSKAKPKAKGKAKPKARSKTRRGKKH